MSATQVQLTFGVTIEDVEHWPDSEVRECALSNASCDEWVVGRLHDVMLNAGNEFIANNPDLFRSNELV